MYISLVRRVKTVYVLISNRAHPLGRRLRYNADTFAALVLAQSRMGHNNKCALLPSRAEGFERMQKRLLLVPCNYHPKRIPAFLKSF